MAGSTGQGAGGAAQTPGSSYPSNPFAGWGNVPGQASPQQNFFGDPSASSQGQPQQSQVNPAPAPTQPNTAAAKQAQGTLIGGVQSTPSANPTAPQMNALLNQQLMMQHPAMFQQGAIASQPSGLGNLMGGKGP